MYIAVIVREGKVVPIVKGGGGPDSDCLATWESRRTAIEEANQVPLARAYDVLVLDLDDAL